MKDFRDQLIINASATYVPEHGKCAGEQRAKDWSDQWQYAVRLRKKIHDHGIFIGVGWERVNDWWEGNLEVDSRF